MKMNKTWKLKIASSLTNHKRSPPWTDLQENNMNNTIQFKLASWIIIWIKLCIFDNKRHFMDSGLEISWWFYYDGPATLFLWFHVKICRWLTCRLLPRQYQNQYREIKILYCAFEELWWTLSFPCNIDNNHHHKLLTICILFCLWQTCFDVSNLKNFVQCLQRSLFEFFLVSLATITLMKFELCIRSAVSWPKKDIRLESQYQGLIIQIS